MTPDDPPSCDSRGDGAADPTGKLHACLDMISCYASMMSTLRLSPEFLGTPDLLQMMEALNELLADECRVLEGLLDARIRPESSSQL